jgi:ketosteroid isomerase-like protein
VYPAGHCRGEYSEGVTDTPIELAQRGLEAWRGGDFDPIERMLDPNVEWRASEPGEWDCHGRDEVMQTIRERYEQGFAKGDVQFREVGDDAVIVVAHPSEIGGADWPDETAAVMTFRGDRIISMRDYLTEVEALAAAGQS